MAKYHIRKDGTPGVCRARVRPCPYGGDNEHFDTKEEAQRFADEMYQYISQHKNNNTTTEELEEEFKAKRRNKAKSKKVISGEAPVDIKKYQFRNYLNPDGQDMPDRRTYRDTLISVSKEVEQAFSKILKRKGIDNSLVKSLQAEFYNINRHSSFRDLIEPSSEQGLKDAKKAIQDRQKFLIEEIGRIEEEL